MSIANTLKQFLDNRGVDYDLISHRPSPSANRTAEVAHIPGDRLAKAVLLEDSGHYLLAVLPATRRLHLGRLHHLEGDFVSLATEDEVARIFTDCARGAVPAIGPAHGLDTLLDDSLAFQDDIFFEAGDHESLVHLRGETFQALLGAPRHGDLSNPI